MSAAAGAAGAAAAAAAQRHICEMEEHEMTRYPNDLDNWEFKIIRSYFSSFADQAKRQEILAQEAEAQWELLEVFDHARIRLRRPIKAKELDAKLDFDPYRTQVDKAFTFKSITIAVCVVLAFFTAAAIF
ncbi:MAG: nucleoside-specific outer membrane channel protein Tsx, partial [Pirellulaceae bacterium]